MRRFPILALVSLMLLANMAYAATVHGTVYNYFLEPQENAIVEVNSAPKQTYIAKDGDYSFNLPKGEYTITAKYTEDGQVLSSASQNLTIINEGDFVLDLILFELSDEDFELLDNTPGNIETEETPFPWLILVISLIVLAGIGVGLWFYKKNNPVIKETEHGEKAVDKEELENVISIIKQESGRISQKDLRKKLNLSEAKVSLMIADLESLGKVKKIKQGRGNIIVLK